VQVRAAVAWLGLLVATLPALAHASPPDPTWIGGIYDGADLDDAVLAATSTDAAGGAVAALAAPWTLLGAVALARWTAVAPAALRVCRGRAPPSCPPS
jgi:hypothetical protein